MADIEFERPEVIKAYQEGLLAEALRYLSEHSKYYQRMFDSYHIDIAKIRTLEDLVKIPFTEKKDLQLFNDDFLCCPKEKNVDTSNGTALIISLQSSLLIVCLSDLFACRDDVVIEDS